MGNSLTLSGAVRVDESVPRLVARLEPGEVAVIEVADLDRSTALSLLAGRPAAVLNAAPSTTGRRASLGAALLVDGGITVVDDMGADVMTLTEGERVRIEGDSVYRGDELVATGHRRGREELSEEMSAGAARMQPAVESFAHSVASTWESEAPQYLEGEGLPAVPRLESRTVLVVGEGLETARQLRSLKAFSKDFSAFIVSTGSNADLVSRVIRKPDMIIGDISTTPEGLLRKGIPLLLLERPDGRTGGGERATTLGLDFAVVTTSASAEDIAELIVDHAGAAQIVRVGDATGIRGFLEQPSGEAAASFFIETQLRAKLVAADVASALYRPGIRTWQLIGLLGAAFIAIVAAVLFTPAGGLMGQELWQWILGWWPGESAKDAGAMVVTDYWPAGQL